MGIISRFINRRTMNALDSANESKEYISLIVKELKTDAVVTTNNWSDRYKEMRTKFDEEQINRFEIFTMWTRIAWLVVIFMLILSLINMNFYSVLYYCLFCVCLYLFIGYRFWVFNTKLYPPFSVYLRMFYKYPLASIPYNNNHLKD